MFCAKGCSVEQQQQQQQQQQAAESFWEALTRRVSLVWKRMRWRLWMAGAAWRSAWLVLGLVIECSA
jgi:hypothetical protein